MRVSASAASTLLFAASSSKNFRRACAQHLSSVTPKSHNACSPRTRRCPVRGQGSHARGCRCGSDGSRTRRRCALGASIGEQITPLRLARAGSSCATDVSSQYRAGEQLCAQRREGHATALTQRQVIGVLGDHDLGQQPPGPRCLGRGSPAPPARRSPSQSLQAYCGYFRWPGRALADQHLLLSSAQVPVDRSCIAHRGCPAKLMGHLFDRFVLLTRTKCNVPPGPSCAWRPCRFPLSPLG